MEEFEKINWYLPPAGGTFLEDDYLFENSVTFKLLNDQLVNNDLPRNKWKSTHDNYDEDDTDSHVSKKQKTKETTENDGEDTKEDDVVNADDESLSRLSIDNECGTTRWQSKEQQTNKKEFKYIAGIRPNLPYPRTSSLSSEEQSQYIRLHAKFINTNLSASRLLSVEESRTFMAYKALSDRVIEEQTEFNKFLQDQWSAHQVRFYMLDTDIVRYTCESWKHRLKRVAGYHPYYDRAKTVALACQGQESNVQLAAGQILLQLGVVPLVRRPKFTRRVQIPQNYTKMCVRYPPDDKPLDEEDTSEKLRKLPVSQDRNAQLLAEAYGADIVISSSGLKHAANNLPPYDRTWDLPVVVKEYSVQDESNRGSVKKRVIYVDKALPSKSMSVVDRNQWYHKSGIKLTMCHLKDKQSYKFPYSSTTSEVASDSGCPVTNVATEALRKAAVKESLSIKTKAAKFVDPSPRENDDSDEYSDSLCIATDVESDAEETESEVRRSTRSRVKDPPATPIKTAKINVPPKSTTSAKPSKMKQCFLVPGSNPSFSNVSYQLWTLKQTEDVKLQHMSGKLMKQSGNATKAVDIKILVRTKLDGCERNGGGVLPVCLSPKLEYQSEFGAEAVTKAGLIQEWLSMFFRPRSTLLRVGIHAETSEVLLMTTRSMEQLTLECKQMFGFNLLPKITSTLYNILSSLVDLPLGQYLLSHTPTMEAFVLLQKGNEDFGSFNLPKVYSLVNPDEPSVPGLMPWTPVDVNIMMPYHKAFARVPATFHPKHHNSKAVDKKAVPPPVKTGKLQAEKNKEKKKKKKGKRKATTSVI